MESFLLSSNATLQAEGLFAENREFSLGSHAKLSLTVARSRGEACIVQEKFQNTDRMVALHFCLNGSAFFSQDTHVAGAPIRDERCHLMLLLPHQTKLEMSLCGDYTLASFYIDLQHFSGLLGPDFDLLPAPFIRNAGLGNKCSCQYYRWMPGAYAVISQVLNARFSGTASRIFLESKMLEMIALMLEAHREGYIRPTTLKPADEEKIRHAKQLLVADLANPPSLARLARLAATNEFTLKKGFRELFGMPVFQFLQQTRLARAYELFQSARDKGIAEIALEVGYDDHSAFTRAFAQHFGLRPNDVRRMR